MTSRSWSRLAFWCLAPVMVTSIGLTLGFRWLALAIPVWLVGGIPWWRLREHARGRIELTLAEPVVAALLGAVSVVAVPAVRLDEPRLRTVALVALLVVFLAPGLVAVVASVPLAESVRRPRSTGHASPD